MVRPSAPRLALLAALAASPAALEGRAGAETRAQEPAPPAPKEAQNSPEKGGAEDQPSREATAPKAPAPSDSPITLDFYGILGSSIRVGAAPGFELTQRTGLLGGGGIVFAPLRSFALGLGFEHVGLGTERLGSSDIGSATAERSMNALWLDLRVHPLRTESASIFAGIGVGLGWQLAAASRFEDPEGTGRTATITLCDASDSASVGLRAGAGVEIPVGGGFFVMGDGWIENVRLSGEILDACIGGAGTSTLLTLRAGLAYRLDLARIFVNR
jgi:opacity protein-like surface antigen